MIASSLFRSTLCRFTAEKKKERPPERVRYDGTLQEQLHLTFNNATPVPNRSTASFFLLSLSLSARGVEYHCDDNE